MAEEIKDGTGAGQAAGAAKGEAKGAIGDTERVTVNGVERVVDKASILAAAQKQMAGESLMDKFSQEKQAWLEEQRQTLEDAKFARAAKKALIEKDKGAMKEMLVGLGQGADDAEKMAATWGGKMEGEARKATGGQTVDGVLKQLADAVIGMGQQNAELVERLKAVEGKTGLLTTRDYNRAGEELMARVESSVLADDVQGSLAKASPEAMAQLKADISRSLSDKLRGGATDVDRALKESLQENLARVSNYGAGFAGVAGPDEFPISGLPSRGAWRGVESLKPRKEPEYVAPHKPGFGKYIEQLIESNWPKIVANAKKMD